MSAGGSTRVETLVVGGGIGGLATALAIARAGRPVHLLERAPAFTEIGAGLQFGPNASRALDALGVYADLLPLAVQPTRALMMDAVTGSTLTTLELGRAFRTRYGYPYLVLHRNDLLALLLAHCTANPLVTLETSRTVVEVDLRPDGATVTCADASVYETLALVGADGLHSVLRRYVSPDQPRNSGYAAYRGATPMTDVRHAVAADDVVLWIGPGMHLMQYPVRRGEQYNQVAVFRSRRFAAGHTEQGQWGGPEELDTAFGNACGPVREAVSTIRRDRFWPMFDRAPIDTWIAESLVLTGDAAHPMLQYLGQGACQALEDAVELGNQLGRHGHHLRAAYSAFEMARLPRAARCQRNARPWGELWHTQDPLTVTVRNHYFAARRPDDYSELDWLYGDPALVTDILPASLSVNRPGADPGHDPFPIASGRVT